ncbi:MAG: UDP-N-acetylmuramate--L-alanine ligase [Anaerolineae bacterium]
MAERFQFDLEKMKGKGHIHIVGIGGMGLSAISKVLLEQGYKVSGSDLQLSALAEEMAASGAHLYEGHDPAHVAEAELVLISSAVPEDNPEVLAARSKGIPVLKRAEFFGPLLSGRKVVAVAGTHGKSTTAAMIAFILVEAGYEPGFIIGAHLRGLETNGRAGRGQYFVIEADEYDRTFLGLRPQIAVITNIEMDHPDCYRDLDEMATAFRKFISQVPDEGCIIGCRDEKIVQEILSAERSERKVKTATYGFNEGADLRAYDLRPNALGGYDFAVEAQVPGTFGSARHLSLKAPGRHNVLNALAAITATSEIGLSPAMIARGLMLFQGLRRRFERKGEACGVVVVDDYAHHPTEIRATLSAARESFPNRELWTFFQPHTYSRTQIFLEDFARSLVSADHVIVSEIYAAREKDTGMVSGADIVRAMTHRDARYIPTLEEAAKHLAQNMSPGSVLLTLGAGDGYIVGEKVLAALKEKEESGEQNCK